MKKLKGLIMSVNNQNIILVTGSGVLTMLYNFISYLEISKEQILSLVAIFTISGIIGMFKYLVLRLSMTQFFIMECSSKLVLIFVPFVLAIGAKQVSVLYYFVDYIFSLLIVGEIFTILISIQSIRLRRLIDDVDFYNLFLHKFKGFIYTTFKLDRLNEGGRENKIDERIKEQRQKEEEKQKEQDLKKEE